TLQATVSAVLGIPESAVTDDTSPDSVSGWDSVKHLNLVMALEEAFGTSFSPEETMDMTSVKLMRLILEEKGI
ncbi:MAG: Acyl carrier protein, partial [Verrucomicrobiaceae bacterium]|nr:Acyl carrier protein [Verrucomicrobiaceae bacterium]